MKEERNCNNCASVHCYRFSPKYELCKNGSLWKPFDTKLGIEEIHEYAHKLFESFKDLDFRNTYNSALSAFYLEERLYVIRSEICGEFQYTLVEAKSEEEAIRRCM